MPQVNPQVNPDGTVQVPGSPPLQSAFAPQPGQPAPPPPVQAQQGQPVPQQNDIAEAIKNALAALISHVAQSTAPHAVTDIKARNDAAEKVAENGNPP
jgi:hypothetical protein